MGEAISFACVQSKHGVNLVEVSGEDGSIKLFERKDKNSHASYVIMIA